MSRKLAAAALAAMTIFGGCSTVVPRGQAPVGVIVPGAELYGRSIRVESGGRTSVMTFRHDGKVQAAFNGQTLTGDWAVEGQRICFTWSGFRDCWPYSGLWPRGTAVNLKSERGTDVRVTLL